MCVPMPSEFELEDDWQITRSVKYSSIIPLVSGRDEVRDTFKVANNWLCNLLAFPPAKTTFEIHWTHLHNIIVVMCT